MSDFPMANPPPPGSAKKPPPRVPVEYDYPTFPEEEPPTFPVEEQVPAISITAARPAPMIHIDAKKPARYPEEPSENLSAIAGLVLSIIGLVFSGGAFGILATGNILALAAFGNLLGAGFWFGVAMSAIGCIASIIGMCQPPRALAVAGLILSVIGTIPLVAFLAMRAQEANTIVVKKQQAPEPPPVRVPESPPPVDDIVLQAHQLPDDETPIADEKQWQTMEGTKYRGTFVRMDKNLVIIAPKSGRELSIAFERLVPRDQRWIKKAIAPRN